LRAANELERNEINIGGSSLRQYCRCFDGL
jgi:hypothetical protein